MSTPRPIPAISTSLTSKLALPLLALLPPFALLSLHALQFRNGYYALMTRLRDFGPYVLPHTDGVPILRFFTGSATVDYWMQVLNCFFAPCFTEPEIQVLALEFVGAFGVVVAVLAVEGERRGWRVAGLATPWALLMQSASFGLTMPVYAVLSIALFTPTSPLPRRGSTVARLSTLPTSLLLGYLLPTILMGIPAPHFSSDKHQRFVALWQFFPVYIAVFQFLLPRLFSSPATSSPPRNADFAKALDRLFKVLIFASRVTHFAAVGLSISHLLYPTAAGWFSYARLLTPANPFGPIKLVSSFSDGVLAFLQWDYAIGMFAAVVWMGWLGARAVDMAAARGKVVKGESGGVVEWVLVVLLEGPGALVAKWAWEREVVLLSAGETAGKEE